jgi:hypothetical protein
MNPENTLRALVRARDLAHLECPHWDCEGYPNNPHDCCWSAMDLERKVRRLRAAIKRRGGR